MHNVGPDYGKKTENVENERKTVQDWNMARNTQKR